MCALKPDSSMTTSPFVLTPLHFPLLPPRAWRRISMCVSERACGGASKCILNTFLRTWHKHGRITDRRVGCLNAWTNEKLRGSSELYVLINVQTLCLLLAFLYPCLGNSTAPFLPTPPFSVPGQYISLLTKPSSFFRWEAISSYRQFVPPRSKSRFLWHRPPSLGNLWEIWHGKGIGQMYP